MNRTNHPHRPALAAFLSATALVATSVFAQEATPVVPPPAAAPVTVTPPPAEPVAAVPAPAQQTGTSPTPVNPEAAAAAEAEDAARPTRAAVRPATRQPATRVARPRAPAASAPTPAPAAVAPEPIPAPSPSPSATATPATPATPEVTPTPVAAETAPPAAAAPAPTGGSSAWPWLLVGLAVLAAAFVFLRRRRDTADVEPDYVEPEYVEPAYVEPAHVAPLAATPTMLDRTPAATRDETVTVPAVDETATVTDATGEDVAALTAAAPVGDRPWLEFAMRPIRAGTNADEAIVEIELTVGNAGRVAAHDVRISTFMLDEGDRSEMERLLVTPPAGAGVEPVTIDPGEGTRIDATLGLLKSSLSSAEFRPIVVADARYRMADGTEGRTSASFRIGVTEAGTTTLSPIDTARPLMREDIEARLFRDPEHA